MYDIEINMIFFADDNTNICVTSQRSEYAIEGMGVVNIFLAEKIHYQYIQTIGELPEDKVIRKTTDDGWTVIGKRR